MGVHNFRRAVLKGKLRFTELFRNGRWYSSRYIKLIVFNKANEGVARVAIMAPRVIKTKPQKNLYKRITREAIDPLMEHIPVGWYIGILPQPEFQRLTQNERIDALTLVLKKADLFG